MSGFDFNYNGDPQSSAQLNNSGGLVSPVPANSTNLTGSNPMSQNLPTNIFDYNNMVTQALAAQKASQPKSPTVQTQQPQQQGPSVPSIEDRLRGEITNGWNSYFGQLDNMLNGLGDQRSNQEGVVNNTYNQGVSDLNANQTDSLNTLDSQRTKVEQNRTKNLQDISDNISNLMQSGNVYLGAKGAGDSSAANQYAYALTKMGTQQRAGENMNSNNLLGSIDQQVVKVKNIVTQEMSRLDTQKQNNMLGIAQWYDQSMQQLQQAKANGSLSESKDLQNVSSQLLSYALNALSTVNAYALQQKQGLDAWTAQNLQSLTDARNQTGSLVSAATSAALPQASAINGQPQIDSSGNVNYYHGNAVADNTKDPNNIFALS